MAQLPPLLPRVEVSSINNRICLGWIWSIFFQACLMWELRTEWIYFTCRPLVGSIRPLLPSLAEKQSTYFGHLIIDKIKLQMQREMVSLLPPLSLSLCLVSLSLSHTRVNTVHPVQRLFWSLWWCTWCDYLFLFIQKEAVSTSHCSQPNTIEYEMAMEWCLLQERSDAWWKRLYKVCKQLWEIRSFTRVVFWETPNLRFCNWSIIISKNPKLVFAPIPKLEIGFPSFNTFIFWSFILLFLATRGGIEKTQGESQVKMNTICNVHYILLWWVLRHNLFRFPNILVNNHYYIFKLCINMDRGRIYKSGGYIGMARARVYRNAFLMLIV